MGEFAFLEDSAGPRVQTVAELSREIRSALEGRFPAVAVRGEVSNLGRPASGHVYFSLVDDAGLSRFASAQLPVVVWRSVARRLRFRLESGQRVIVTGRVGAYEPRGTYQVVASRVVPDGVGELQLAFERLKERLRAEGLFDAERKRPLPFLPHRIGLVTSPSGAAVRDFLRIARGRFPPLQVRLIPVRVQGEGAAAEIAHAVERLGRDDAGVDVIVVTRGGGSLEDLWAFNEEPVARAIAASPVPVVAGVGHEVDFTIAEFAADVRAPTPTAAGELVTPDLSELRVQLDGLRRRLALALRGREERARAALDRLARSPVLRDPTVIVERYEQALDRLGEELENRLYKRWRGWKDAAVVLAARLESLSPFAVLARGYSVTTTEDGRVLRDAGAAAPGDRLRIRLERGQVRAHVEETSPVDGDRPQTSSPGPDAGRSSVRESARETGHRGRRS